MEYTRRILIPCLCASLGVMFHNLPSKHALATTLQLKDSQLKIEAEEGNQKAKPFTIHQRGDIPYLSTGVGSDQRHLALPPFPLKIIFVEGPRAFLSLIEVTIIDSKGAVVFHVPREEVIGPWLFLSPKPGTYTIVGHRPGFPEVKQQVKVGASQKTEVILRWPPATNK